MDCISCSICAEPLSSQYSHKLKCGHEFHYQCLFLTFKNMKTNRCPYCRSQFNLLPLVNGIKKIYPKKTIQFLINWLAMQSNILMR